jgi:ABC-2 type transport system ATP-binding protein
MKQRICISSALLGNPSIIILDEPTTGLDPRGMSEVRDIIKSLKGKNRLIFMSSHLLGEVSDVCDEVAMIDHGKLIVYDTLPNVTAKFSGGNNVVEVSLARPVDIKIVARTIAALSDVVSAERIDDKNLKISFNGGLDVQERLLNDIIKLNIGVVSYKAASSELEDAYLKLITSTL